MLQTWRDQTSKVRDRSKKLVWFHAPSVGEGLQARPIIQALQHAHPDIQIAYSFFSPSAEQFAKTLNVDVCGYLPFDSTRAAQQMMEILDPAALFFVKLDVWPNLVAVASQHQVKIGLLSATVAPSSGRQGTFARALLHDAYSALEVVGAIDADNAQRLATMGVQSSRVSVTGDTRFDQVWARANAVDRSSALLTALQSPRPTLVAGSTWPADEAVLLPAWLDVKARIPNARLIIAPHEPTAAHLNPIQEWARQNELSIVRLGDISGIDQSPATAGSAQADNMIATRADTQTAQVADVVLVDRVGVLGDIYAIATVAFVGGAFHSAGLHSVIEPAAYGVPVVFGPAYGMSREAELLLRNDGARSVFSRSDCTQFIGDWLAFPGARAGSGAAASAFVQSELGASERSLALVLGALG